MSTRTDLLFCSMHIRVGRTCSLFLSLCQDVERVVCKRRREWRKKKRRRHRFQKALSHEGRETGDENIFCEFPRKLMAKKDYGTRALIRNGKKFGKFSRIWGCFNCGADWKTFMHMCDSSAGCLWFAFSFLLFIFLDRGERVRKRALQFVNLTTT